MAGVQSFAELFAVLVKHRVVAVHGALTTMQMLLKKPDNRLAAVLMASHVVRVCDAGLYGKEQDSLASLRGDLMQVPEPIFQQDIAEILRKARQDEMCLAVETQRSPGCIMWTYDRWSKRHCRQCKNISAEFGCKCTRAHISWQACAH